MNTPTDSEDDSGSGSGSGSASASASASDSGSGSSSDSGVEFPDDFPLDLDVYDQVQFGDYRPPSPARADPNDPRRREFDSLYPLDWLVADPAANGAAPAYEPADIARLRTRWQLAFQQNTNGDWKYVEYVPAWSDPDWTTRYTYIRNVGDADKDEIARQYAKAGMLQTQRPALRPDDAALNPTETAKRWGVYPWQAWEGLEGRFTLKGSSGVTPRAPLFPTVQLDQPRFSPDAGRLVDAVTVEDLANERQRLEDWRRQLGMETTNEDFRQSLQAIALDNNAGPTKTEKAASLLAILEALQRTDEREEYQRVLFAGNTANELVEQNAWTLGANASTDLANPLHDLLTRDKWARTDDRGVSEDEPRTVYNISGKQGEYTAHNETLWTAIQPALQLVTQVLDSQHPAILVWADVRKLRPIEDARGETDSSRIWKFCTSPDHDVTLQGLTGLAFQWDDFVDICASGFDTTEYVCEILKRTIQWEFKSQWRVFGDDDDDDMDSKTPDASARAFGSTELRRIVEDGSSQPPFRISITLAADMIWPLLVDEYSQAEKAATTVIIAATMLHELAHALVLARCQMFMPGTCNRGDEPLWLLLDPSWPREIADFNQEKEVDILGALQLFGMRMLYSEATFEDNKLFYPKHEVFWQTEPYAEEGWATENQYFGGIFESLLTASVETFASFPHFRFLEEASWIVAMRGWETDSGYIERFQVHGAIAMSEYQKFYSEDWWNSEFMAYGPIAMRIFNTATPIRGYINQIVPQMRAVWDFVGKRYGDDARNWLRSVWRRMRDESENQFLWRYLFYQTITATEAEACEMTWFHMQKNWNLADIAVWNDWSAANDRATELAAAWADVVDFNTDTVLTWNAMQPLAEFRRLFVALWHMQSVLNREATYFQHVAARFITLEDRAAKDELFRLYAGRIRTRITDLYIRVVNNTTQLLIDLDNTGTANPNIKNWLLSRPEIARMWNRDAPDLLSKLRIHTQYFNVVLGVFSEDVAQRISAVDQLGAIPAGVAQPLAKRIKRLAMRQYHALAPTDPRRKTADEWSQILTNGDLLRNPTVGSPAADFNQRLRNRVVNIGAGVATHQAAVAGAFPDLQMLRQIGDGSALLNQQPPAAAGPSDRAHLLAEEEQAAFTLATGFQPYRDTTTGFTRFADARAQQPSLQQQPGALSVPQDRNPPDPGTYLNSLDRRIEQTGAQLQQMSQPRGQPMDLDTPVPTMFGAAAAQQGQAMQQIEGMLGQRASTQSFMQNNAAGLGDGGAGASTWGSSTDQQQRQFLGDQAQWRQNFGI